MTVLGGCSHTDFSLACVVSLKMEELIRPSPRGKKLGLLLEEITKAKADIADIAVLLISKTSSCITSGRQHKLTPASHTTVWSTFHQLRGNREVKDIWGKFLSTHIPESCLQESELAYQLLIKRLLKRLLRNKAEAKKQGTASA